MILAYNDGIGIVKIKLDPTDSVAFFDGWVFATAIDGECLKLKIENLLYIERD